MSLSDVISGMELNTELTALRVNGFPSFNLKCILRFILGFCMLGFLLMLLNEYKSPPLESDTLLKF